MSTWRTRAAVAATLATLPLGACQRDEAPTALDPTPETSPAAASSVPSGSRDPWDEITVPAGAYARWTPTLSGVRPWSADDSAVLAARVDDAQAREWTATFDLDELPLELAHAPGHDRVRLYVDDGGWVLEVHVDAAIPLGPGEPVPMVVCQQGQYGPECVRVTGDETANELTSLLGDYTDVFAPMAGRVAASQTTWLPLDVPPTDPDHVFLARVDSPVGPLECAVEWPEASADDLEGKPLVLGSSEPPDGHPAWCVDQRGLVLVSPGDETSLTALMSMAPVVDGDVAEYPAEISSRVP